MLSVMRSSWWSSAEISFRSLFRLVPIVLLTITAIMNQRTQAQGYAFGMNAFTSPLGPTAITAADFNKDGKMDFAVAAGTSVAVILGRPDGTFAPYVSYSAGQASLVALATGDFNGDGKLDIAAVSSILPGIQVLLGNGDGTFRLGSGVQFSGLVSAASVTAGDFNKDGKIDLAVACSGFSGSSIAVILLGKGDGTFQAAVNYATTGANSVVSADFNRDGKLDLLVGDTFENGGDVIGVLLGNGDGTFQPYTSVPIPGNGGDTLAVGDLNHDGKSDVVVASGFNLSGGVTVLLGNGDGTFQAPVSYFETTVEPFADAVAIGDFNGDGTPDIAVTNHSGNVSIFIGNGDGTLKAPLNYPSSLHPVGLAIGDFNGDGRQDIATVGGYVQSAAVTILIGRGDGTFSSHANYAIPLYPTAVVSGDFNLDGKPDIAVTSFNNPGSVSVLLNKGNNQFQTITNTQVHQPYIAVVGDFNNDGKLDLVVSDYNAQTYVENLSTLLGNGDGTLQAPLIFNIASGPYLYGLRVADINMDGKLDIVAGLQLAGAVTVYLGQGDGTFKVGSQTGTGADAQSVFVADFNGDGRPDVLAWTSNGALILLGNGDGTFQQPQPVLTGYSFLGVGDFNHDGKTDVVVIATGIGIALGNGDGTFRNPTAFVHSDVGFGSTVVGDFNGDGNLDLAGIDSTNQTVSVLPGVGDGTFGQRIDNSTENSPWSMTAADFSGSGGLDFAVTTATLGNTGNASIYPNRPVGTLFPGTLRFGNVKVGTSKTLKAYLHNSGGTPLAISNITVTTGFSQRNNCGPRLAVGATCTIDITLTPTAPGKQTGKAVITDSSTAKPQLMSLTGTGN